MICNSGEILRDSQRLLLILLTSGDSSNLGMIDGILNDPERVGAVCYVADNEAAHANGAWKEKQSTFLGESNR